VFLLIKLHSFKLVVVGNDISYDLEVKIIFVILGNSIRPYAVQMLKLEDYLLDVLPQHGVRVVEFQVLGAFLKKLKKFSDRAI
jgi:hypothetical protein